LKKLARAGWVTSTVEPQGSRPPRQIYRITPEGRAELHRWLSEPVMKTREIRLEFLVKLYFAWRFNQAEAARLIAEQRETLHGLAASLTDHMAQISSDGSNLQEQDAAFLRHVLALRLSQTQAAIDWLEQLTNAQPTDPIA
jgi:DNA-binding PadR family transcriptional regulator